MLKEAEHIAKTILNGNNQEGAELLAGTVKHGESYSRNPEIQVSYMGNLIKQVTKTLRPHLHNLDSTGKRLGAEEVAYVYDTLQELQIYLKRERQDEEKRKQGINDLSDLLLMNRGRFWVWQAVQRSIENTELLAKLSMNVAKLCSRHVVPVDPQNHYLNLQKANQGRTDTPQDQGSTLVIYRRSDPRLAGKWMALEADLQITETPVKTAAKNLGSALIPRNMLDAYFSEILEPVPYNMLHQVDETTRTACVLYAESDITFTKARKLAEGIQN